MDNKILMENAITFAAKIVKIVKQQEDNKVNAIFYRAVDSAADIGVSVSEANYARSRAEHMDKLRDALSRAAESEYWIKLLYSAELIDRETHRELLEDCMDVKRNAIAAINAARE